MRCMLILLLSFLWLVGCQEKAAIEPPVLWGVVDPSLPADVRARQDALARLLKTIQTGTSLRHVKSYEPDLNFQEASQSFFGEGIQLSSWNWARPPQGDKLFVSMNFLLDEAPGDKKVSYERTYVVSRTGNQFTIRRADSIAAR